MKGDKREKFEIHKISYKEEEMTSIIIGNEKGEILCYMK